LVTIKGFSQSVKYGISKHYVKDHT